MFDFKMIMATLLIAEGLTLLGRFAFRRKSKEYYVDKMHNNWKKTSFHWHHFIFGLAIIPISLIFSGMLEQCMFNLGIGLFLSDMAHHFIFLLALTGNAEFHLFYKNKELHEEEKYESLSRRNKVMRKLTKFI
jgi:hypothetical protein